jgi:hypothetical protein
MQRGDSYRQIEQISFRKEYFLSSLWSRMVPMADDSLDSGLTSREIALGDEKWSLTL